jgi:hypothetical protein
VQLCGNSNAVGDVAIMEVSAAAAAGPAAAVGGQQAQAKVLGQPESAVAAPTSESFDVIGDFGSVFDFLL